MLRPTLILCLAVLNSASVAFADSAGSFLWDPPVNNEANVYARVIELQHAGSQNGKLLATWEHWYDNSSTGGEANGTQGSFIIRESNDTGYTWTTLSTVYDEQTGSGHPCTHFWQPFLFEFPRQLGQYPEGTILLVGNLVPSNSSWTQFYAWRSSDQGNSWTPVGEWQYGYTNDEGTRLGIWEPFLYLDDQDRLVAVFSDERDPMQHSQMLVHVVSEDGGDTWGEVVRDVASDAQPDRPGMATVALMDNGEYIMSYEICGRPMCPAHVKKSWDGVTWNTSYTGVAVQTYDNFFPGSSPYIAWDPHQKQLYLAGLKMWYTDTITLASEDHRSVLINTAHGDGPWYWAPAPFQVNNQSGACNSDYSPNLLPLSNGQLRYTAPSSHDNSGLCAEMTGEAPIGLLPFDADFAQKGQAGWINVGGNWSVSGSDYVAIADNRDATAITGSTAWTDYEVEADVMVSNASGVVAVSARVSAPIQGTNAFLGYLASINAAVGNLTLSRISHQQVVLASAAYPGGFSTNTWYHLSMSVSKYNLTATVTGSGNATTVSSVDNSFPQGMAGLLARPGGGTFRNVTVKAS